MANSVSMVLKDKFGRLLHYLVSSGFTYELIQEKILRDPFFLCFEENDASRFLSKSIESVIQNVFDKATYLDYSANISSELYWAGQMYIGLLLNESVPLQRSILIVPIDKMIGFFPLFHEMSEANLYQKYLDEERRTSVFRLLSKGKGTIKSISYLTGINSNTLNSYIDNSKLFSCSMSNATKLASLFEVPLATLNKETNFVPDIVDLLDGPAFKQTFIGTLATYLKNDPHLVEAVSDGREFKEKMDEGKYAAIYDRRDHSLYFTKSHKFRVLTKAEVRFLSKRSIQEFKPSLASGEILF